MNIDPKDIIAMPGSTLKVGVAGIDIKAGQSLCEDDVDGIGVASPAKATVAGIALHNAVPGAPIAYVSDGDVALGRVLRQGMPYLLGDIPGDIMADTDKQSGCVSLLGIARSDSVLAINIHNSGVSR